MPPQPFTSILISLIRVTQHAALLMSAGCKSAQPPQLTALNRALLSLTRGQHCDTQPRPLSWASFSSIRLEDNKMAHGYPTTLYLPCILHFWSHSSHCVECPLFLLTHPLRFYTVVTLSIEPLMSIKGNCNCTLAKPLHYPKCS